ncbi:MAG: low specificity L-threonine aldolase, partial [Candidatus Latescibacteria bacterium]|nr:low specificity L-threonine aldolase [Candidatus Latescibacterota bacterium]
KLFADGIRNLPGIELDLSTVETNIIIFKVTGIPSVDLVEKFKDAGLLVLVNAVDKIRAVTHLDVTRTKIEEAVGIVQKVMVNCK